MKKRFAAYFYCNGADFSLGISICFHMPNIEIHVPFGFFRIGLEYERLTKSYGETQGNKFLYRTFGYVPR